MQMMPLLWRKKLKKLPSLHRAKNHLPGVLVVDVETIKKLAQQCNIMELDGYIVNLWDDQDGSMRIRIDQFNDFCNLLSKEINILATPGSSDVGQRDA